jgi:mono/diheme cytochrome c family protein/glucose/arabinose dehydrogenase
LKNGDLMKKLLFAVLWVSASTLFINTSAYAFSKAPPATVGKNERIVLLGNGLGERMLYFPHFETELHRRFPKAEFILRNISRPGDTAGFRPHPARESQWAFPGAEKFHPELQTHEGVGHYPTPNEWLTLLKADTILAFFGYNESFDGLQQVDNFYREVDAYVTHTLAQKYNGQSAPRLILVSPIAFENLSMHRDLPNGKKENRRLAAYTDTMRRVAEDRNIEFVDLFSATKQLYKAEAQPMTINGFALSDAGYRQLSKILISALYSNEAVQSSASQNVLYEAVKDKNWIWLNDYRILNGVHVYGRRHKPFGLENYPEEIDKLRQMGALRDKRIHDIANGKSIVGPVDDSKTRELTKVETNFNPSKPIEYLNVEKALEHFDMPEGFKIDLFASESEFPELRNPVQMSFDNKGRLWVAVVPSYPHYQPGAERPNDKLLILEDTDNDGRADKKTVFADGLHLPIGFELAPEGVYVAQQPNLMLLVDDNGDDRADRRELLLHGFDSHDTHHSISAFSADASGAFYMNEGRFLHSQIETPYGPQRCSDGGVWRFDPKSWRLERFMQTDLNNPWGIAFDQWEQSFLSDASGGDNFWSLPLSAKVPHGYEIKKVGQFTTHRVRPTSGSEFVFSRHFPDHMQGDFLINNTIGFLGTKQHTIIEDGAGFTGELRQDLVSSDDPNFRPVDMEFAPDGSLYIVDWHNALIGHMQHSSRDPNRDHDHGRIYRVTYPSRPLVEPAQVAGASIEQLLDNLKQHEYRTRYRSRRELRGRPADQVLPAIREWVHTLDSSEQSYERYLLEGLWASWAQNQVDTQLLEQSLHARSYKARAAAVRVLRFSHHQILNARKLLVEAANDSHARVRLEAIIAASWLDNADGAVIALEGLKHPITKWMGKAYEAVLLTLDDDIRALEISGKLHLADNTAAQAYLRGDLVLYEDEYGNRGKPVDNISLREKDIELYKIGEEVYHRDAYCKTCHGEDATGIANIYPPLRETQWVKGDKERLIKIVLKGLWGPISVNSKTYDPAKGVPPMTAFGGMLNDKEIAGVLTYIRAKFGGGKGADVSVFPEQVTRVRRSVRDKKDFYKVSELLKEHPFPNAK